MLAGRQPGIGRATSERLDPWPACTGSTQTPPNLIAPRIFSRVFCDPGTLPEIVRFYQTLTSATLDMDMDIPEGGLHVVAVGPFLLLEMNKDKLDRAGQAAETHVTVLSAHLDDTVARQGRRRRADRPGAMGLSPRTGSAAATPGRVTGRIPRTPPQPRPRR
jgi:hypothetical protein